MGGGSYSYLDAKTRSFSRGDHLKSTREVFKQRQINNAMSPIDVKLRESRDSSEHPNSLAIIIALDVTGSMGSIPHHLVKEGLPQLMDSIIKKGIKDPQVLFLAIGDHECDQYPLQVGQFESSDELLDHWLTSVYLEGGGGGNDGESYLLSWYFAGFHTSIDCFEKRKQKGVLISIGDEPCLSGIPKNALTKIMGDGQYENYDSRILLDRAKETYSVFHLHLREGSNGHRQDVIDGWKQLIGGGLYLIERKQDIADTISNIVISAILHDPTKLESQKNVKEGIIL